MAASLKVALRSLLVLHRLATAAAALSLPGTAPLTTQGDLSAQMVAGIDRFLDADTARSNTHRQQYRQRDFSSADAYEKSVQTNRDELRRIVGATDQRRASGFLNLATEAEFDLFVAHAVRWNALSGVSGEGLRLVPKSGPIARVIAIPDADQSPELIAGLVEGLPPDGQFARGLAENGCEVLVPVLIDRNDTWSGD